MLGIVVLLTLFVVESCVSATNVNFTFTWTAPGDDSTTGTASGYEMKYWTDSISLVNSWASCITVASSLTKVPQVAGTAETLMTVINLNTETTYFFAIKAKDEVPNWSPVSNIVRRYIPDNVPPAMIIDFGWK